MTMPASGAINFGQLQTEFGGSNPIGLNEYYRSGTYVPPLTANASVPVSGAISISNFYSASVATNMAASYVGESIGVKGSGSTESFTVYNNGNISSSYTPSSTVQFSDTWCASSSAPGNWYEVYVTLVSGTTPTTGTMNTWLALTSDRTWSLNNTNSCILTVKIRHKYNTASEESATVTLTANA